MGGLIALLTILKTQESGLFSGIVLMGPLIALDPAMATPMKVFMAKAASRFLPSFSLGGIDPALVTSDQVTYIFIRVMFISAKKTVQKCLVIFYQAQTSCAT